ncbi:peptidoglycan D,D-transpeptidase FtsI family protein [Paenibacillus mendelii]|uniref:Peptidoglycan D,D-transpeptidase FtsI family protein n=1 Tax=Paenibacillus mendelii TaxID=206163 RepID=A0ABV6JJZ0_9BACL|nr:penicillin-binding transpeptidase domain-containing protein [Paenibacillus mendelii]MCQ6558735.1 penicillin-binding protein 2 [Paenibacillus mendelii]
MNRRHFSFRLNLFFFATFFLFSVLIVRLAILQFVEGPQLKEEESALGSKPVAIPPIRGNILDSSGQAIAYSTSTQSMYYTIEPGTKVEDSKALAARLYADFVKYGNADKEQPLSLEDIIKNMDLDYRKNTISVPRRIKTGLNQKEIAYFLENRDLYKGIEIVEESIRHYDKSTIAVQLVGYLKKFEKGANELEKYKGKDKNKDLQMRYLAQEDVGYDGLEMMYQDELRGKNGLKTYPINSSGRIIGPPVITKPEKGDNIVLTINRDVQLATEQAIMDQLDWLHTTSDSRKRQMKAKTGYAVAMEVNTGKVIAMASMPDYDPVVWEGGGISNDDYEQIKGIMGNGTIRSIYGPYKKDEELKGLTSSLVPLGSTQKPLTVLVGLSEKLISTSTSYNDTGAFYYGKEGTHRRAIRNSGNHAYGSMDPARAIAKSSNPFMAEKIGNALYLDKKGDKGVEVWDSYMKQFGLGVSTESGLPGEQKGIINYFHEMKDASAQSALIQASFGQQGRYTTLQLAQYTAMLANRGKRMKPQFVSKITDREGNLVKGFTPEVLNTVEFPSSYWKEVESGMSQVKVKVFEDAPYRVNRKTGTSEQVVAGKTIDNSVFIAYAPAENPVIAVAVVVPFGGFGSDGAAPIARKIFDAYDENIGLHGVPKKSASNGTNNTSTAQ